MDAIALADVLIEGFRPGVMERLGLGPEQALAVNPRLIYGRMTGWGQTGPLAQTAGHDINYIGITGALAAMGRPGEPAMPPLNLVGDFGGGSMLLAFGIAAALHERNRSGQGQVIDAAIVDGTSSLMTMFAGLLPSGRISMERDANMLGGAAPFYRCYVCADGREIAVGAIEPHFYAELIRLVGAPEALLVRQHRQEHWAADCALLEAHFRSRALAEWMEMLEGSDACAGPVLPLSEARLHPHLSARRSYVEHEGVIQSSPVPRFSRTPGAIPPSADPEKMLRGWQSDTR